MHSVGRVALSASVLALSLAACTAPQQVPPLTPGRTPAAMSQAVANSTCRTINADLRNYIAPDKTKWQKSSWITSQAYAMCDTALTTGLLIVTYMPTASSGLTSAQVAQQFDNEQTLDEALHQVQDQRLLIDDRPSYVTFGIAELRVLTPKGTLSVLTSRLHGAARVQAQTAIAQYLLGKGL